MFVSITKGFIPLILVMYKQSQPFITEKKREENVVLIFSSFQ